MFGTRYLATLFGFVFFSHQVGAFLGVWLGGATLRPHRLLRCRLVAVRRARHLRGDRPHADQRERSRAAGGCDWTGGGGILASHSDHAGFRFREVMHVASRRSDGYLQSLSRHPRRSDEAAKRRRHDADARRPDAGRCRYPRRILDRQLQGRPRHHRQAARRAALPDDPRHRLRRHGDGLDKSGLQGRATR